MASQIHGQRSTAAVLPGITVESTAEAIASATAAELQHAPGPASGALLQLPFEPAVPAHGPIWIVDR